MGSGNKTRTPCCDVQGMINFGKAAKPCINTALHSQVCLAVVEKVVIYLWVVILSWLLDSSCPDRINDRKLYCMAKRFCAGSRLTWSGVVALVALVDLVHRLEAG